LRGVLAGDVAEDVAVAALVSAAADCGEVAESGLREVRRCIRDGWEITLRRGGYV
jgi:hypothetical protein